MTEARSHTCEEARRRVTLAVSHDVSAAEAHGLWAHLSACADCRRAFGEHGELRALLQRMPGGALAAVEPERAAFFERLQADVLAAVAADGTVDCRRPRSRLRPAMAAVGLFFTGLILVRSGVLGDPAADASSELLRRPAMRPSAAVPAPPERFLRPLSFGEEPLWGLGGLQTLDRLDRSFEDLSVTRTTDPSGDTPAATGPGDATAGNPGKPPKKMPEMPSGKTAQKAPSAPPTAARERR